MNSQERLSYLIENIHSLSPGLVEAGVDILAEAGEVEFAAMLAKDNGLFEKAIQVLVDAGDYLWAALIAKNAGLPEEAERLYRDGLEYYIEMEMYGRAISAAQALHMSPDHIDHLMREGIAHESSEMDMGRARVALDSIAASLEAAIEERDDELSREVMAALKKER
ncbi:MAG: hypothetical protein JW986_06380 [Methanotrichaceae archaeon]|nr:hypothetical protein [Methanotrichaceae archaeon]